LEGIDYCHAPIEVDDPALAARAMAQGAHDWLLAAWAWPAHVRSSNSTAA
jgi:hypothetical protein